MGNKTTDHSQLRAEPFTPLQQRWTTLWTTTLPKLASSQSTVQNGGDWPVIVDHSFARVILDNVVSLDKPWSQVVTASATASMTEEQLEACIAMAEQIRDGTVSLNDLDEKSLKLRGITSGLKPTELADTKKRKRSDTSGEEISSSKIESNGTTEKWTRKQEAAHSWSTISLSKSGPLVPNEETEMMPDIQLIIAQSNMKPFQKEALTLLTLVPRGRWTTYQAISNAMRRIHEPQSSHQASGHARAVGLAMRNNPFAPTVPCHRMLSRDRRIGGFHGKWETEGGFYHEKMRLLREEGVQFDEKGRAVGEPFTDFETRVQLYS